MYTLIILLALSPLDQWYDMTAKSPDTEILQDSTKYIRALPNNKAGFALYPAVYYNHHRTIRTGSITFTYIQRADRWYYVTDWLAGKLKQQGALILRYKDSYYYGRIGNDAKLLTDIFRSE